jgi:hypothetical protein
MNNVVTHSKSEAAPANGKHMALHKIFKSKIPFYEGESYFCRKGMASSICIKLPALNDISNDLPKYKLSNAKFFKYAEALRKVTESNENKLRNKTLITLLLKSRLVNKLKREEMQRNKRRQEKLQNKVKRIPKIYHHNSNSVSVNIAPDISSQESRNLVIYLPGKSILTERSMHLTDTAPKNHNKLPAVKSRKNALEKIIKDINPIRRFHEYMNRIRKSVDYTH